MIQHVHLSNIILHFNIVRIANRQIVWDVAITVYLHGYILKLVLCGMQFIHLYMRSLAAFKLESCCLVNTFPYFSPF